MKIDQKENLCNTMITDFMARIIKYISASSSNVQKEIARKNRAKSKAGQKRIRKIEKRIKEWKEREIRSRREINRVRKLLGQKPLPKLKHLGFKA